MKQKVRDGACFVVVLLHFSDCATTTRYNREYRREDAHTHTHDPSYSAPDMVTPSHRPLIRVI